MRAEGITKKFATRTAVNATTWTVHRGLVHGLAGPNGAGKTTLLRMIAGLVAPTAGRIEVDGVDIVAGTPPAGLGALIESPGFVPHLSGRSNLRYLARVRGTARSSVNAPLSLVGLADVADRRSQPYRTYSLGMKQRLGVAAALLGSPRLLLLDEPTNGLDPSGVADMHDLIRRLGTAGVTVIVSSHALADIEQLCQRVTVMKEGRIVADATVEELCGSAWTKIRSRDHETISQIIARHDPGARTVHNCDSGGSWVEVHAASLTTPSLVRLLVAADVDIDEVTAVRRSLSQVYEELLHGPSRHESPAPSVPTSRGER